MNSKPYTITKHGVSATKDLHKMAMIGKVYDRENLTGFADKDYFPTPLAKYIKQEGKPNCAVVRGYNTGDLYLLAIRTIKKGEDLICDFDASRFLKNKSKQTKPPPAYHNMLDHLDIVKGVDY